MNWYDNQDCHTESHTSSFDSHTDCHASFEIVLLVHLIVIPIVMQGLINSFNWLKGKKSSWSINKYPRRLSTGLHPLHKYSLHRQTEKKRDQERKSSELQIKFCKLFLASIVKSKPIEIVYMYYWNFLADQISLELICRMAFSIRSIYYKYRKVQVEFSINFVIISLVIKPYNLYPCI